jgi:hypothetical protein
MSVLARASRAFRLPWAGTTGAMACRERAKRVERAPSKTGRPLFDPAHGGGVRGPWPPSKTGAGLAKRKVPEGEKEGRARRGRRNGSRGLDGPSAPVTARAALALQGGRHGA